MFYTPTTSARVGSSTGLKVHDPRSRGARQEEAAVLRCFRNDVGCAAGRSQSERLDDI